MRSEQCSITRLSWIRRCQTRHGRGHCRRRCGLRHCIWLAFLLRLRALRPPTHTSFVGTGGQRVRFVSRLRHEQFSILLVPQYFYCDSRATGVACWYYFQSFLFAAPPTSPRAATQLLRAGQRAATGARAPRPRGRTHTLADTHERESHDTRHNATHTAPTGDRPPARRLRLAL